MADAIALFIFFFAVIDPIGTVPIFIAVTAQYDAREKRKIAIKATLFAAAVLIFFVVAGEIVLNAMDLPLATFQIFGGAVLFLFALSMIFGESKPEQELELAKNSSETAIFPLAMPSIAGPGAILAALLQTENAQFSVPEQIMTTVIMLLVLVVVLVLMLAANTVHRIIGDSGASVLSRIMGLIFGAVAVSHILGGIKDYFSL